MNRALVRWLIVLVVTLATVWVLRVSSATYPLHGSATLGGSTFRYALDRTHSGSGDHTVRIETRNTEIQGALEWKPLAENAWRSEVMRTEGAALVAAIPHPQSPAGIAYRVRLVHVGKEIVLPEREPAVLWFRDGGSPPGR